MTFDIEKIITSIAAIFSVFKRDPKIAEEKAERMDIKNKVRKARAERKIKRIERKMNKKKPE